MTIALIASGQIIRGSLAAEFGDIPPAFLPLGNERLFVRQIEFLKQRAEDIFMSVPADFEIPHADERYLAQENVRIIRSDPALRLGEALSYCVNVIGVYDRPLMILYGDTLVIESQPRPDSYSMHPTSDHQAWAAAPVGAEPEAVADGRMVISGLFFFANVPLLLRSISLEAGDFLKALGRYHAVSPLTGDASGRWFDFGHIQTYYTSCGLITTQRSFNDLTVSSTVVEKISEDGRKMDAEASWFETLPEEMRVFTPAYLGRASRGARRGYRTANTYLATLASLAVFGRLDSLVWTGIMDACDHFLTRAAQHRPDNPRIDADLYYHRKTISRLEAFAAAAAHPIDRPLIYEERPTPSMIDMARISSEVIADHDAPPSCLIHGDFCFSNIFYDFRSRTIKLIDPRGLSPDGRITIHGDPRYDVAKLAHSAVGGYDMIIAGRMRGVWRDRHLSLETSALRAPEWLAIVHAFERSRVGRRYPARLVNAILVHLFLSMLPLHSDRPGRQAAFAANAARLFLTLES